MDTLYVGNLPFSTTEEGLQKLLEPYGSVSSVRIIKDKMSNRSKGYAFVEMDEGGAENAMQALNGTEYEGRTLKVDRARPPSEEPRGNDGGRRSFNNRR